MKNIFRLFIFSLLIGGWGLAAASLHVIRSPGSAANIALVPKSKLQIQNTYVDTRNWTMQDASNHPALITRLIDAQRADLLSHVADPRSKLDLQAQLIEAIHRRPETKPSQQKSDDAMTASRLHRFFNTYSSR